MGAPYRKMVIANQSSDWCGNPLTFQGAFRYLSRLTRGFPESELPEGQEKPPRGAPVCELARNDRK